MKKKMQGSGLKGVGGVWKSKKTPCLTAIADSVSRYKTAMDIAHRVYAINVKRFGAMSQEARNSGVRYDNKARAFHDQNAQYVNALVNANRRWQERQARP